MSPLTNCLPAAVAIQPNTRTIRHHYSGHNYRSQSHNSLRAWLGRGRRQRHDHLSSKLADDPPPEGITTIEEYSRTLAEAIDALGIERLALLGTHTGADFAVELATARMPNRIDGVMLPDRAFCAYHSVYAYRADDALPKITEPVLFVSNQQDGIQPDPELACAGIPN